MGTHFAAIVSRFKSTQLLSSKKRAQQGGSRNAHERGRFPLILDDYVLREFLTTFCLVLSSFVLLMLVFTFFELLGDIIRNRTPLVTVGEYLINLTPSMVYNITPLGVLVAVLVTFGVLTRTNEFTAMKATGISLYRVMVPILVVSAMLAVALFLFDESYLPGANRRQEALRSVIKRQTGANLSAARPEVDLRPPGAGQARAHLLLPVLRSGSGPLRQPNRLRIQPGELLSFPPHLRLQRPLGAANTAMGL